MTLVPTSSGTELTPSSEVALARGREVPGRLTVRSRVVRKVVDQLAREVPGVVHRGAGLGDTLRGRPSSPSTEVRLLGPHADVSVDCDVGWPCNLDAQARAVRDQVLHGTRRLTAVTLHVVDVHVRPVAAPAPERVVQ